MQTKYLRLGQELAIRYLHTGTTTLPDVPPPFGRGRTILFLHGEGGSAPLFSDQLDHFSVDHSPLALDLPAHGRSTGLLPPESVEAAGDIVATALTALAAPPTVLVGHGLGGQIALATALADTSRVHAVVTIGTGIRCDWPEAELEKLEAVVRGRTGQFFDTPFFGETTSPDVQRRFWGAMVQTDPRVRLDDLRTHRASKLGERLAALDVPVHIVRGDADRLCSRESASALASLMSQATTHEISGAGHVAHLERPEEVHSVIEEACG